MGLLYSTLNSYRKELKKRICEIKSTIIVCHLHMFSLILETKFFSFTFLLPLSIFLRDRSM